MRSDKEREVEMKGGENKGGEPESERETYAAEVDGLNWAVCGILHTNTHHFQLTH